ncbi:MAG: DUF192 domain-containing protein [Bacteroidota bacterium]
MIRRIYFAAAAALLVSVLAVATGCTKSDDEPVFREIQFRKDGTLEVLAADGAQLATLNIEIAEGDSAQARGLMDRRSLPPMSGMLFVGDEIEEKSFWMERTPMPLDIIFISADSQVVSIARRTRPYSRENITSNGPAKYVLEVRAGMSDRIGIDDETRFRWTRD